MYIYDMNVSLKLDNSHSGDEKPLFIRLRMKKTNGKYSESSISTEIRLLSRHFKNNGISKSTPNYTSKNKIINSIIEDIYLIIGEIRENGLEPKELFTEYTLTRSLILITRCS